MTPTQVEREEHERTHVPYRSWCRHCVAARASNSAHRGGKFTTAVEKDKDMKQVSKDHCFMQDQPGNGTSKDSGVQGSRDPYGISSSAAIEGSSH